MFDGTQEQAELFETSTKCGELFAALAKAQAQMTAAAKDVTVTERRKTKDGRQVELSRRYATLASTLDAVRPVLAAHDLCVMQFPGRDERGNIVVTTQIGHASGQWVRCSMASTTEGLLQRGVQAVGSVITYLRRYTLQAVCGIAQADDDDDGHAAGGGRGTREAPDELAARRGGHHPSWEGDRARFCAALGEMGVKYDDLADYLHQRGRKRPSRITTKDREQVLKWLSDGAAQKVNGGGK